MDKKQDQDALNFSASASHAAELATLTLQPKSDRSWTLRAKNSVPLAFALYLYHTFVSWIWTFVTSPASILLDPLSTGAALFIYPVVWLGLGGATFVFWLAGLCGGRWFIDVISKKFAKGYSPVNWVSFSHFFP